MIAKALHLLATHYGQRPSDLILGRQEALAFDYEVLSKALAK